jgi:cytochrome bd-type quinol oxidase subunit 2
VGDDGSPIGAESEGMTLKRIRKPLLLVHITASVALLGATSSSLLLAVVAATTADADLAHSAYELMSAQSLVFGIPLSFIALGSGIALGPASKWGVLRYWWTTLKLGLLALVIVNGALNIGRMTEQRLDGGGSEWALVAVVSASVAMLLASVALSVFKPGGRLRHQTSPSRQSQVSSAVRSR